MPLMFFVSYLEPVPTNTKTVAVLVAGIGIVTNRRPESNLCKLWLKILFIPYEVALTGSGGQTFAIHLHARITVIVPSKVFTTSFGIHGADEWNRTIV